jgi:L-methionine (R)-S-oxide reductase
MAEELIIPIFASREEKYQALIPQIRGLICNEKDFVANAANTVAAIHLTFGFLWTGCYFVKEDELVLGPFQGPVACTRIAKGKGVCGSAWLKNQTICVPDVDAFPGHIACSSLSKSEIVIPLRKKNGEVFGVLDVDSSALNDFQHVDQNFLEQIADLLSKRYDE